MVNKRDAILKSPGKFYVLNVKRTIHAPRTQVQKKIWRIVINPETYDNQFNIVNSVARVIEILRVANGLHCKGEHSHRTICVMCII